MRSHQSWGGQLECRAISDKHHVILLIYNILNQIIKHGIINPYVDPHELVVRSRSPEQIKIVFIQSTDGIGKQSGHYEDYDSYFNKKNDEPTAKKQFTT